VKKLKYLSLEYLKKSLLAIALLLGTQISNSQPICIKVDQIARWEVLDSNKTIIYDNQGSSIAFIIFSDFNLKKNGENFRFFSSSICKYDRVQTSSQMTTISSIEQIRK